MRSAARPYEASYTSPQVSAATLSFRFLAFLSSSFEWLGASVILETVTVITPCGDQSENTSLASLVARCSKHVCERPVMRQRISLLPFLPTLLRPHAARTPHARRTPTFQRRPTPVSSLTLRPARGAFGTSGTNQRASDDRDQCV